MTLLTHTHLARRQREVTLLWGWVTASNTSAQRAARVLNAPLLEEHVLHLPHALAAIICGSGFLYGTKIMNSVHRVTARISRNDMSVAHARPTSIGRRPGEHVHGEDTLLTT